MITKAKPGIQTTEFIAGSTILAFIWNAGLLEDPNPWVRGGVAIAALAWSAYYAKYRTEAKEGPA